ncbi:ABC transporter permease [Adhaeribacter rhizoryzae]|uniref:FtsX-like permease family protein n=1 Tax=Adhaeribacter rhizoryzae TaxID=2607907 RepID=A0A5M6DPM4_9BACT|nr:ABC transporter permease [Adhaeribacter rhizoryzae]KAA5549457.1 FtsX-like permease family protein [Adhaeribacter rhizoryzae]
MLHNYFKLAFRNLWRNKVFSFINIGGLSLGLACCMLIFLYIKDEVSYDRFHAKKDRIYRVTANIINEGEVTKTGSTNMVVGPSFKQAIPEIEAFVRMQEDFYIVRQQENTFNQEVVFADESIFSVFSLPLLAGNPRKALSNLNSLVLTEKTAQKYFGDATAIGKTLELKMGDTFKPFVVTGIAKNPPQNSSLQFEVLLPFKYTETHFPDNAWLGFYMNTFVVLNPLANPEKVAPKLNQVFLQQVREELQEAKAKFDFKNSIQFGLQPLLQIHLDTAYADVRNGLKYGSNPVYAYILTGIAIFMLLIACINFVNLTVAHSLKRGKEIGIRKVIGGNRLQLTFQFLGESFLLCFLAFALAVVLVELSLPFFNEVANKRLSLPYLLNTKLVAGYLGLFLLTGFLAGFYPALVLSSFKPIMVLQHRYKFNGNGYLAKGLVIFQFAVTSFLMIATLAVYDQFNFLTHKNLGYHDENLAVIHLGRGPHAEEVKLFKNELAQNPNIQWVATKDAGQNYTVVKVAGKEIEFAFSRIDENFLPTLQIPIVKGRNFSPDFPADAENAVIINETFAQAAGWRNPVGKKLYNVNGNPNPMTVVGVVKDYHYASLKEKIGPQLFVVGSGDVWVKMQPQNIPQTLKVLAQTHRKVLPFKPFEFDFINVLNEKNYEQEAKWKQLITVGAVLSIFISCIGLFGLATLAIQQRTKEIGIRKVFGAAVSDIVLMLSTDFTKVVALAFFISVPVGYYAINTWLQDFPYRISLNWWLFALPCLATLLLALLTIAARTFKAAVANPIKNLRVE